MPKQLVLEIFKAYANRSNQHTWDTVISKLIDWLRYYEYID